MVDRVSMEIPGLGIKKVYYTLKTVINQHPGLRIHSLTAIREKSHQLQ